MQRNLHIYAFLKELEGIEYENATKEEVYDILGDVDNWGKYLIENSNKTIVGKSLEEYDLTSFFRDFLEKLMGEMGTGKVPMFSLGYY